MLKPVDTCSKLSELLEKNARPTESVYHYTTWNGLKGILESQELWLTDYVHLNDSSEIHYAIELIVKYVLTLATDHNMRIFWEDVFFHIRNTFLAEYDFFIFSCCMKPNYLYAWRTYGDDGAGFAIEFKKEFFTGGSFVLEHDGAPMFCRTTVYYGLDDVLKEPIGELVKNVEAQLRSENVLNNSQHAVIRRKDIAIEFLAELFPCLTSIKHDAYKEEHEYRIYASKSKMHTWQEFFSPVGVAPHLNSKKRTYFKFDLKEIINIWVGPCLNFRHAKKDIEEILSSLKANNINVANIGIIASGIPYKRV